MTQYTNRGLPYPEPDIDLVGQIGSHHLRDLAQVVDTLFGQERSASSQEATAAASAAKTHAEQYTNAQISTVQEQAHTWDQAILKSAREYANTADAGVLRSVDTRLADMASAYDVAVANGFQGDVHQWLLSLKGQDASNVLPDLEAVTGALGAYSANAYGADPSAEWQTNRDAFQAANDAAHASGGGIVTAKPGNYRVRGIIQDSHVTFHAPGAKLIHPDGNFGDIINARRFETTGSITAGSTTMTVTDPSVIEVGAVVAIRGAGGRSVLQSTTLSADANSVTTAMRITDPAGWANSETAWIGNELIIWQSRTDGLLEVIERGAYGTTAAEYNRHEPIYQAVRHYSHVTHIDGNTITIADPAPAGVTAAPVTVGSIDLGIFDTDFDGARQLPSGSSGNPMPVRWDGVRLSRIRGGVYANGDLGAIQLAHGARDNIIEPTVMQDSGIPAGSKGAAFWLFRGCTRNRIIAPTVTGDCYNGIYIDDRTVTSTEWDAGCDDNTILAPTVDIARAGSNGAIAIVGSQGNQILGGSTKGTRSGIIINANQHNTHTNTGADGSGNLVTGVAMRNHHYPVSMSTPGNRIINNPWRDMSYGPYDTGGNYLDGNGMDQLHGATFAHSQMPPGYHWTFPTVQSDTSSDFNNSRLVVAEFNVPRTITIDEVGIEVVSPASAGRIRWGYYYDDGFGRPGDLAWDAGANYFDLTTEGIQYVNVNREFRAGRYWIGAAMQLFDGGTLPVLRIPGGGLSTLAMSQRPTPGASAPQGYEHADNVNGTFPAVFNPASAAEAVPAFYLHVTS